MRLIPLSKGYSAMVDDEDFDSVSKYNWSAYKVGDTIYAARKTSSKFGKRETVFMHRFIMGNKKGDPRIDHKDRNGLNDTRENLRDVTGSQNQMNAIANSNKTSLYKGVFYRKENKKFRASIMLNGKVFRLGYFASDADAGRAYNKKAKELFGEFSRLNIIV